MFEIWEWQFDKLSVEDSTDLGDMIAKARINEWSDVD